MCSASSLYFYRFSEDNLLVRHTILRLNQILICFSKYEAFSNVMGANDMASGARHNSYINQKMWMPVNFPSGFFSELKAHVTFY